MPTYTRHRIQFPPREADHLSQDKAFFDLVESGAKRRLRFHDYDEIYKVPGLYEQLFYDRLKCQSPAKVAEILKHVRRADATSSSRSCACSTWAPATA